MPDAALKNAQGRRDVLAARINKLHQQLHDVQAELRSVDQWIALWHTFAVGDEGDAATEASPAEQRESEDKAEPVEVVDSDKPDRTRTTGNPKKEVVADAARSIIEAAGEPVSRSDLYKELSARGIVVEGKDPEQVLSTMMWRTRDLVNVTRLPTGGYWLAERPHEASGYDPRRPISAINQILNAPAGEHRPPKDATSLSEDGAVRRHAALSAEIAEADRLYHGEDAPEISDTEYDALRREIEEIEARFPNLVKSDEESKPSPDDLRDAQLYRETDEEHERIMGDSIFR